MDHAAKVDQVVRALRAHRSTAPLSLAKRAVTHRVPRRVDHVRDGAKLDVSELDSILEIDPDARTCTAEPGVTFVDLVTATLKHGLVPLVVPELATITIGGAVSGCSIESMSFRHGGFHDSCLEYEVITTTGDVLRCRPDNEHALVFHMMHGSFGTLGVLSKLVFRLTPAKQLVHVRHQRYSTISEYLDAIERHSERADVDFIDGFIHTPKHHVLSIGRFVDTAPYTHRYDWWRVYYKSTRDRIEDYLTTPQYFFRYDHGVTNVHPKSLVGRLLFGKLMTSARTLAVANKLPWLFSKERPTVTVDVFVPLSRVPRFLDWYEDTFHYYPLWIVPYRRVHDYEWLAPSFYEGVRDQMFLDLAVYGMEQRGDVNYYVAMEQELMAIGGVKTLISHNYYSEADFWSIWNKPNYDAVKSITDPDNRLRDLYDKTCRAAMGIA
jgi:hypothetical protein